MRNHIWVSLRTPQFLSPLPRCRQHAQTRSNDPCHGSVDAVLLWRGVYDGIHMNQIKGFPTQTAAKRSFLGPFWYFSPSQLAFIYVHFFPSIFYKGQWFLIRAMWTSCYTVLIFNQKSILVS